jgi:peroxiredoxin/outer membrane lipoprotein-sorting protein
MTRTFRCVVVRMIVVLLFFIAKQSRADDHGTSYLNKTAEAARSLHTLSADLTLTWQSSGKAIKQMRGSVVLMKPNYALLKFEGDYPLKVLASDGTTLFTFQDTTTYTKTEVDPNGERIDTPWWGMPFRYFFTQSVNPFGAKADPTAVTSPLGQEAIGSLTFRVVSVHGTQPMAYTAKLYFDTNNVLERTIVNFGSDAVPSATFTAVLTNLKLNDSMEATAFHFTPPANTTLKDTSLTDKMLAIGDKAPDFTLSSADETNLSLQQAGKGMRGTLIDFWYLECAPCRIEFPELEKLYQRFHAQGFNIVAIDKNDSANAVAAYAHKAGITFPIVLGRDDKTGNIFEQYQVSVFPAAYLLDEHGRIVYRATGADIDGLRAALTKMGLN